MANKTGTYQPCLECGKAVYVTPFHAGRKKYCSIGCMNAAMFNRPNLKKRKPVSQMRARYLKTRVNGKNVTAHRHIMELAPGRALLPTELIHHINGDRYDNRIENLQVVMPKIHSRIHNAGRSLSAETRAKISKAHKGRKVPNRKPSTPEGNRKRSESMKRARAITFWSTRKK